MGFVGLHFHNTLASTVMQHMSLKKFKTNFSPRKTINLCTFCQKHTLTPYQLLWCGWGKSIFVFIFMIANFMLIWNHSKSCTPQLTNHYHKTKVGAYNDKVPWGCRRFESWNGSATRIPFWSDLCLQEILPMGIKLLILRPGLENQSWE